jgi:hypothetical protein
MGALRPFNDAVADVAEDKPLGAGLVSVVCDRFSQCRSDVTEDKPLAAPCSLSVFFFSEKGAKVAYCLFKSCVFRMSPINKSCVS